jgi:hypothetical protein
VQTPQRFTGLDWLALLAAAWAIGGLLAFPGGPWERLFRDFGIVTDSLPLLTRCALWPWSGLVLASPALASLALGLRSRHIVSRRRRWFVAAVVLSFVGAAVRLVLLSYLPVFVGAEQLRAE